MMGLPKRNDIEHRLDMSEMEKGVYEVMATASKLTVEKFLANKEDRFVTGELEHTKQNQRRNEMEETKNVFISSNPNVASMHTVLVALLRMRQAAVHFALTKEGVDESAFEGLSGVHIDTEDLQSADNTFNDSINEQNGKIDAKELFLPTTPSTKVTRIIMDIEKMSRLGEKGVVISQWTTVLDMFREQLRDRGISTTSITGKLTAKERDANMVKFKDPKGPQIMLLSLTAGGVELNLVSGNHLFMVDLHWNPQLEEQAFCRIYRYGQTKDVYLNRYVMASTIEERVLELQQHKKVLAESVLSGKAQKNALTMADLRFLFGLDD